MAGRPTGYSLRSHKINFNDPRMGRGNNVMVRRVAIGIIVVALLIVMILLVSSCVRGCSSDTTADTATTASTTEAVRVSSGLDETTTSELTAALDKNDEFSWIAANANIYPTSMINLALREPAAIDFVRAWPDAEKTASTYDDTVTKGTVPQLMMFDTRWGNLDYNGNPLGATGSGPTCVSMAYMALTGAGDKTPADIATRVVDADMATGSGGMSTSFITNHATDLGLTATEVTCDSSSLATALSEGKVVICEVKASTLTDDDHFVVLAKENDNTTLAVYDPTSTEVSSHEWSYATIVSSASGAWELSASSSTAATTS